MVGFARGASEQGGVGKAAGYTAQPTREEDYGEAGNFYAGGADADWSGG
jgi:hypothetical protein